MASLGDDTVLLRWLATERIGEAEWPRLAALLDDAERARAARFHFERDRRVFTAAHALLRATLSDFAEVAPRDWRFSIGEKGKPEAILRAGDAPLRANISHTRGLAAVALTLDRPVGVDVEWVKRDSATLEIAERFFAPDECAQLFARPADQAEDTFFAFWTLKEAYIKAVGLGLSLPLDAFAFSLDAAGEPRGIAFTPRIEDDPACWRFQRFRCGEEHVMALAVSDPEPQRLAVVTEAVDPAALLARAEAPTR